MKCDRCDNPAAYTRKYSGEKLCSQCFSRSIVRKTAKTISSILARQKATQAINAEQKKYFASIRGATNATEALKIRKAAMDNGLMCYPGGDNEAGGSSCHILFLFFII